jgi:hypothetical protein
MVYRLQQHRLFNADLNQAMITYNKTEIIEDNAKVQLWKKSVK